MDAMGAEGRADGRCRGGVRALGRKDQRAKGRLYLQGLMLKGRRKSMQPMAQRLGVNHQQLQQFVSSARKVQPVRLRLAALTVEAVGPDCMNHR